MIRFFMPYLSFIRTWKSQTGPRPSLQGGQFLYLLSPASVFVLSGAPQTEQGRSFEKNLSLLSLSKETGLRGQYSWDMREQQGSA